MACSIHATTFGCLMNDILIRFPPIFEHSFVHCQFFLLILCECTFLNPWLCGLIMNSGYHLPFSWNCLLCTIFCCIQLIKHQKVFFCVCALIHTIFWKHFFCNKSFHVFFFDRLFFFPAHDHCWWNVPFFQTIPFESIDAVPCTLQFICFIVYMHGVVEQKE